jgi:hypothetical protein
MIISTVCIVRACNMVIPKSFSTGTRVIHSREIDFWLFYTLCMIFSRVFVPGRGWSLTLREERYSRSNGRDRERASQKRANCDSKPSESILCRSVFMRHCLIEHCAGTEKRQPSSCASESSRQMSNHTQRIEQFCERHSPANL